jgi:hypothetical protein
MVKNFIKISFLSVALVLTGSAFAQIGPIPPSGGGGHTTSFLTANNSGTGAASGTTFNGSAAVTISNNTIGALPVGGYYGGTSGGSGNAQTITLNASLGSPTLAQLTGILISFTPGFTQTSSAPTLNVNGLGAVTIVKGINSGLSDNDILTGDPASVVYNGTNFQLLNPLQMTAQVGASGTGTTTTANVQFTGGQAANSASAAGTGTFKGGSNIGVGGGGSALLQAGSSPSSGTQGFANVQQSFITASALAATFEVVSMTTTADEVSASGLGSANVVGIAQSVGGTNLQLFVVSSGKTTVRFDGTPVIGDIACAPIPTSGTAGLAHDGGVATLTPCSTLGSLEIGVITGQVSGTGSGATATVLVQVQ